MSLFSYPRCPQCLSEVPLDQLWSVADTDRMNMLKGNVGVACPVCGIRLRVTQFWSGVGAIVSILVLYGSAILIGAFENFKANSGIAFVVILAATAAMFFAQQRLLPRLAQVRALEPGEAVVFPLDEAKKLREESLNDE